MLIRRETSTDVDAVRAVIAAAFARPDQPGMVPVEVTLVDELRTSEFWIPGLSLIAVEPQGHVMGHVLCTRGRLGLAQVLALAPLCVRPDQQRRGVGQALMHAMLGAAEALDEPLVALVGDSGYYQRFGFRLAQDLDIDPPVPAWAPHFQVRVLTAYGSSLGGMFAYPAPFDQL